MGVLMRSLVAVLALSVVCAPVGVARAQAPEGSVAAAPAAAGMTRPSTLLEPSLTALQQALAGVKLEKWKMPGEMREQADGDLRSIERDFEETLPPLLATADGEPGSLAKVLPVAQNVGAVYDVALRVAAMGKLAAPTAQSAALEQALASLADARRALADQMQANAVAEGKRVGELQADVKTLKEAAAARTAAEAQMPAAKAPVVRVKKAKPRVKPAAQP